MLCEEDRKFLLAVIESTSGLSPAKQMANEAIEAEVRRLAEQVKRSEVFSKVGDAYREIQAEAKVGTPG